MALNNALRRLRKNSILVTDIAAQFWCEKQMELGYLFGKKFTPAMKMGTQVHATLQAEVYEPLKAQPLTYQDSMYKMGYESYRSLVTLADKKIAREIKIYGSLNGYRLSGKIDELRLKDGEVTVIEQKTTSVNSRFDETKSRPHKMQVALYKKMLDDIKTGSYAFGNFANSYLLGDTKLSDRFSGQLKEEGVREDMMGLRTLYTKIFTVFSQLPKISDTIEVHYLDRESGKEIRVLQMNYKADEIQKEMENAMRYWNGERDAKPVVKEEAWKCRFCKFYGKECTVWWPKVVS